MHSIPPLPVVFRSFALDILLNIHGHVRNNPKYHLILLDEFLMASTNSNDAKYIV